MGGWTMYKEVIRTHLSQQTRAVRRCQVTMKPRAKRADYPLGAKKAKNMGQVVTGIVVRFGVQPNAVSFFRYELIFLSLLN